MKKGFAPILILLLVALVSIGYIGYKKYQSTPQTLTIPSLIPLPTPIFSPSSTEIIPTITQNQLNNGWYYGSANQRKPGTPADWLFIERGRSSCWHKPENSCEFTPNMSL